MPNCAISRTLAAVGVHSAIFFAVLTFSLSVPACKKANLSQLATDQLSSPLQSKNNVDTIVYFCLFSERDSDLTSSCDKDVAAFTAHSHHVIGGTYKSKQELENGILGLQPLNLSPNSIIIVSGHGTKLSAGLNNMQLGLEIGTTSYSYAAFEKNITTVVKNPQIWLYTCHSGACQSGANCGVGVSCQFNQRTPDGAKLMDSIFSLIMSGGPKGDCSQWQQVDTKPPFGVVDPDELNANLLSSNETQAQWQVDFPLEPNFSLRGVEIELGNTFGFRSIEEAATTCKLERRTALVRNGFNVKLSSRSEPSEYLFASDKSELESQLTQMAKAQPPKCLLDSGGSCLVDAIITVDNPNQTTTVRRIGRYIPGQNIATMDSTIASQNPGWPKACSLGTNCAIELGLPVSHVTCSGNKVLAEEGGIKYSPQSLSFTMASQRCLKPNR